MKKNNFIVHALLIIANILLFPGLLMAQQGNPPLQGNPASQGNPPLQGNPQANCGANEICDPLGLQGEKNAPQIIIGRVINAVLGIVGSLALLMFVYGGLMWMTSAGSQEKVEKGRQILIWATAGLALVFFSYVLVRFTISSLTDNPIQPAQTSISNQKSV